MPRVPMRDDLLRRARDLAGSSPRAVLGIAGAPGAGKSTLVRALLRDLSSEGVATAWLPMDGFHLSDAQLHRLGRAGRKGAIDTFDGWGYVNAVARARSELDAPVYVPDFERDLEQPIAAGLVIDPGPALVVTEGNYLFVPEAPWNALDSLLDESWFVTVDADVRRARLVDRHVLFGKSRVAAERHVALVDEPNARLVEQWRDRADVVVQDFESRTP